MTASTTVSWRARASSLVALLLLIAGVASCGSAMPDRAQRRSIDAQPEPRLLARPSHVQRDNFALLRTWPEGLPARIRRLVRVETTGMNPALAQRIRAVIPGSYWLIPGIGHLCIVSEIPGTPGVGTVCARTPQVLQQGLATVSLTPAERVSVGEPARLVVGIVPDHTSEALVHTHDSIAAVPVVSGVFVLRDSVPAPSDFLSLRRTRGD
jgi:hypothetical protein